MVGVETVEKQQALELKPIGGSEVRRVEVKVVEVEEEEASKAASTVHQMCAHRVRPELQAFSTLIVTYVRTLL